MLSLFTAFVYSLSSEFSRINASPDDRDYADLMTKLWVTRTVRVAIVYAVFSVALLLFW